MKKILFVFAVFVAAMNFSFLDSNPLIVVVDAGHGGHDPGNITSAQEQKEKDITLEFAKKLVELADEYPDVKVILTRAEDEFVELKKRVELANTIEPDVFISVHLDAYSDESVNGMRLMVSNENAYAVSSKKLGEEILDEVQKVESINIEPELSTLRSYVLRNADCPALMFSLGYMSNSSDRLFIENDENLNAVCVRVLDALRKD